MTAVRLNGFLPEDFAADTPLSGPVGLPHGPMGTRTVDIADARALQAEAESEAAFFAEHGFVLLSHASAVRDWDSEVASVYLPEIEALTRERLFPGRRIEVQQYPSLLRRGRDTPVPFYAEGVHSDGGRDADDYAHNIAAFSTAQFGALWRGRYDRDDVEGMLWLDFWRPTNMAEPLEHMPLALCDVSTLDPVDLVSTELTGIAPEGRPSRHLSLRFNNGQRWYSYPHMTVDELLVFNLAGFDKEGGAPRNCFHSAFRDPGARADAQERQSCEHRVGVLLLKD